MLTVSHRYAHILAYLRQPESTPEAPACLPHAARLNGTPTRMEALLELRDEAAYLGLDELRTLCVDELRHRQAPSPASLGLHIRGLSSGSSKSLHTLREQDEPPLADAVSLRAARRRSDDSGFASADAAGAGARRSGGSAESEGGTVWPSPMSLRERALRDGSPRKDPVKDHFATMKARPTGPWI